MAILSELVAICANHGVDSEPTLSQFARELREAGRVSKAGRGRGAARMTFLDASRFLIACAATDHPKRAAEAEQFFSAYQLERERVPEGSWSIDQGVTLDRGLAQTLEALADGAIDADAMKRNVPFRISPSLELDRSGGAIEIELFGDSHRFLFWSPSMVALMRSLDALEGHDRATALIDEAESAAIRFRTGKNLTAKLNSKLLRAVATAIGGEQA